MAPLVLVGSDRAAVAAPGDPLLSVDAGFVTGLDIPWDLDLDGSGNLFFTERSAFTVKVRRSNGQISTVAADQSDAWSSGETGLMAIELDPGFAGNRRLYTCQGTTDNNLSVQVIAWQIDPGFTQMTRVADPLVGGIDGTSGRHGGCQLRFDAAGALLIGTGDAATGTNPQSLRSLNGKVLRVDPVTGAAAAGNPGIAGADPRIFTVGHRNVQGLAVRPGSGQLLEVEHGTTCDDELNVLTGGVNYGWNPVPGYDETRPMTDLSMPGARPAVWSSGCPTLAPSGASFLSGSQWAGWNGALAMSFLKDSALRIFFLDGAGNVTGIVTPPELDGTYGRLRAAELGPDGALYLTTSNGGGADRIVRVVARSVDPIGSLELVQGLPGGVRVAGWALDPDTTSPTEVHVYVDGWGVNLGPAAGTRPDVDAAFPGSGAAHGFDDSVTGVGPGIHQVCAYAINTAGPGSNRLLGCRTVDLSTPVGSFDLIQRVPGGIRVAGWAIDPDTTSPTEVHVYVDGWGVNLGPAAGDRPDIAAAFPGYGAAHGFDGQISVGPGTHGVCAYGIDTAGPGSNRLLGCRTFVVAADPLGRLELVAPTAGGIRVAGWAFDPDTSSSIPVHVYVDGWGVNLGVAAGNRPDVAAFFPGYGAAHGFDAPVAGVGPGAHQVCAYGINAAGAGGNALLGCRSVTT